MRKMGKSNRHIWINIDRRRSINIRNSGLFVVVVSLIVANRHQISIISPVWEFADFVPRLEEC